MKHVIVWPVIFSIYYSISLIAITALWVAPDAVPAVAAALIAAMQGVDFDISGPLWQSPQWVKLPLSCYVAAGWALVIMLIRHVLPRSESREMKAEIRAQEALIDAHIQSVEDMGFSRSDAQRIVQLKQNAWWHDGLTPAERRELAETTNRQHNQFRRAAE